MMGLAAVPTDRIFPWDDPVLDGLLFALAIFGLLWWLLRREARRVERDPLSEPISHVRANVDANGRTLKVGVDVHARACVDDEGRVDCGCGLAEREAATRGGAA